MILQIIKGILICGARIKGSVKVEKLHPFCESLSLNTAKIDDSRLFGVTRLRKQKPVYCSGLNMYCQHHQCTSS